LLIIVTLGLYLVLFCQFPATDCESWEKVYCQAEKSCFTSLSTSVSHCEITNLKHVLSKGGSVGTAMMRPMLVFTVGS